MNELSTGTSLTGQRRSAGVLTCGDAGGLLGVCTEARIPGLQDQGQQQELRLHRAPPHLRPLQGRRGLGHPNRPAAANFSRERGRRVRPGPTIAGGSEPAKCAQRTCGGSRRRERFINSPRGRRRGGPRPGYWPPADPPRRCVRPCGRLRSASAPRLRLFV